jgi:hypothetical protein
MSSEQTKIKIPPRMKIESFMNQMQKKTKQILCLLNNNEVLILDIDQISYGMWKKWKEDEVDCFYYIDEDKNEHIKIFSSEANNKLGSIPLQVNNKTYEKEDQSEVKQSKNKFEEFMNHPSIQNPIPMITYQNQPAPQQTNPYIYNGKSRKEQQKINNMQKFNQIQPNFTTTSTSAYASQQNYPLHQNYSTQQNLYQQQFNPYQNSSNQFYQLQQTQLPNQMFPLNQNINNNPLTNGIPHNIMNQFHQENVLVAKNSDNMINNYYEQNKYIPFYNGVKQMTNKSKEHVTNEKPLKLESKYMA